MVLLTFVWKCFQDRNFHGVVVGLYEQSIESWVGLLPFKGRDCKERTETFICDSESMEHATSNLIGIT